jgi:hypothetical protein
MTGWVIAIAIVLTLIDLFQEWRYLDLLRRVEALEDHEEVAG